MDDLQKAQPRKPNIFGEVYRPPPAGYTRETGNKHIKSLMSAATPAAPQPLILPPPTAITPRPVTMATQKPAKPAKSKTKPGIEDYSTPYVPPVPDATEKEAQKEEQATQKHLAPLQGTSQTSPALEPARIKRHEVLSTCTVITTVQIPGDDQALEVFMLPLDKLDGWLFGVSVNRVKPELRPRLIEYQRECFDVLAKHFGGSKVELSGNSGQLPGSVKPPVSPLPNALRQLAQPELPGIDVSALLLSGQCAPRQPFPTTIEQAIDKHAWSLAHDAYSLLREHLSRRVAFCHVYGEPRTLDQKTALQDIKTVTLGQALAHTYISEMRYVLSGIESAARIASDAERRVREQIDQLTQQHQNGAAQ